MKEVYLGSRKTGTYILHSNTKLILEQGAGVFASEVVEDYYVDDTIFEDTCNNEFGRSLFYGRGVENVEITGKKGSVINGCGVKWKESENFLKRPSLIRLVDCKNVKLTNLSLLDSPCWGIHLLNCENVTIENISIVSKWGANNDGIDIDCCRNVRVNGCVIDTGDDCIAIKGTKNVLTKNIVIENCRLQSDWAAFKIGTESVGDFEDIVFRNNTIDKALGCAIKIVPTDGGSIYNCEVSNIEAKNVTGPIFIANGERMRTYYGGETRDNYSRIKDVTIDKFKADVIVGGMMPVCYANKGVVVITGTKENPIENVVISDSAFTMPGGEPEKVDLYVEELGTSYPEFYTLGELPASGVYFRHVHGIKLKNVTIKLKKEDARPKIVSDDVKLLKIR